MPRKNQSNRNRRHSSYRAEALERRVLLASAQAVELFDASPALFVQNQGQWTDQSVRFAYQGSGASIGMTDSGVLVRLVKSAQPTSVEPAVPAAFPDDAVETTATTAFSIRFDGAKKVQPIGQDRADSFFNYYVGDQGTWRSNVPGFGSVLYSDLYKGIDLSLSGGNAGHLKYEFRVAAGADYRKIKVGYDGVDGLSIDVHGNLHIHTNLGEVIDNAPYAYQLISGQKVPVTVRYQLVNDQRCRFRLGSNYDPSQRLVIDPNLDWSSYLGGTNLEYAPGIAIDPSANALVAGYTQSTDFAGTNNSFHGPSYNGYDAFVAKVSTAGSLVWATYLGGSGNDFGYDIAVDSAGNALVTGTTHSTDFAGANNSCHGSGDAFVEKVSASGTLVWSTYLGGVVSVSSSGDKGFGIVTDSAGNALVMGVTDSPDFAGANNSFHGGSADAFVAKVSASGTLVWATYLGGSTYDDGEGITIDSAGNVLVTGYTSSTDFLGANDSFHGDSSYSDTFVAKVSGSGTLVWATYLGGSTYDFGGGIAIDPAGNAVVGGGTSSTDFAGSNNSYHGGPHDAFIAKVDASGTLVWATYLGGSGDDGGGSIAIDFAGNALVAGWSRSTDFAGALGGGQDAFVAKLSTTGTLVWATYLGGSAAESGLGIAIGPAGNALVTGSTNSADFPAASNGYHGGSSDAFVAKISDPFAVCSASFLPNGSKPALRLGFSFALSAPSLAAGDLLLTNQTTGQVMNCGTCATVGYDPGAFAATWSFPALLADGYYHAELPAASVNDSLGRPLSSLYGFDFFSLGGDANHDGVVDLRDLYILATNWKCSGKLFCDGDFNYDSKVDACDLGILSKNWQRTADGTLLSSAPMPAILGPVTLPPAPAPLRAPTRTAIRVVSLIE